MSYCDWKIFITSKGLHEIITEEQCLGYIDDFLYVTFVCMFLLFKRRYSLALKETVLANQTKTP